MDNSDRLRRMTESPRSAGRSATNGRLPDGEAGLVALFQAKGCYGRLLDEAEGKHAVLCPWEDEHSSGRGESDSDTVIWDGRDGRAPAFCCQHQHCDGRTARTVLSLWLSHPPGDGVTARTTTLRELEKKELAEQEWVVPGMIPRTGQTTLAGPPKCGKSLLATQLAYAVAAGGQFLGARLDEGAVLYLALEDTARRLQARLRRMFPAGGWPERCEVALEWRRLDQGGTGDIEEWLDSRPDARLAMIDTLGRVRPPRRPGGGIYDEDYELMARLQDIGKDRDVAILVIHHTRKMASENPFDTISGTLGLNGAADSMLVLKRPYGSEEGTLCVTGREVEERELAVRFDKDTLTWRAIGDAALHRMSEERREVIDALFHAGGTPLTPKEIAERMGVRNDSTLRSKLHRMVERNQLLRDEAGRYALHPGAPLPMGLTETFCTQ